MALASPRIAHSPTVDRYVDAARSARLRQLLARPRRLLPPALLAAGLRDEPAPGWSGAAAGLSVDEAPQSGPQLPPHADGVFRAVGASRRFEPGPAFWADDRDGLLFLFHLHGFERMAEHGAADGFWPAVLDDWLAHCGRPSWPGWHPYPLSTRIRSWCAALSSAGAPSDALLRSLWLQARLLRRSVEHDIGGNHVLNNAVALVMAGVCLETPELRRAGERLLDRELASQVLGDGGHEERSPSYHRTVTAQLADAAACLRAAGHPVPGRLDASIAAMRRWMIAMAGPDGTLPLLNDAWEGPSIEVGDRPPVSDLGATGHLVLRHGGDQAVLDLAPLAPRHLPPHAHADALSFVLWLEGRPLVVDPGSHTYSGPDRNAFRGTAAHSTVAVDGADQCELWGPFRASFMPTVRRLALERRGDAVVVVAEHDGYRRLADPVVHRRTFCWLPGDGLVVVDRLLCSAPHRVSSALPLAPGADGPLAALDGAAFERRPGRYAPYLGAAVPSEVLVQEREVAPGEPFGWSLLRSGPAALAADGLRLVRAGRPDVELA